MYFLALSYIFFFGTRRTLFFDEFQPNRKRAGGPHHALSIITLFNVTNARQHREVGVRSLVSAGEVISTNHLDGTRVCPVSREPQEAKVVEIMANRNRPNLGL